MFFELKAEVGGLLFEVGDLLAECVDVGGGAESGFSPGLLAEGFGEPFLELLDAGLLSILNSLGLTATGEGEVAVLEELFEPVVKLFGVDVEFIAQVRDRNLFEEMPLENGNLFGAGEVTTVLAHDEPPFRLC